jgi:hypothetical protein
MVQFVVGEEDGRKPFGDRMVGIGPFHRINVSLRVADIFDFPVHAEGVKKSV